MWMHLRLYIRIQACRFAASWTEKALGTPRKHTFKGKANDDIKIPCKHIPRCCCALVLVQPTTSLSMLMLSIFNVVHILTTMLNPACIKKRPDVLAICCIKSFYLPNEQAWIAVTIALFLVCCSKRGSILRGRISQHALSASLDWLDG